MLMRILIVDDSSLIRNLLRKALEAQPGWEVWGEAANGKEGIEMAQTISPDLVVLDLSMPVMNGLQAARILRRRMPNVAVIMFTTFCTKNMESLALAAGVDRVISKSSPSSDLIECARSLLNDAV